MHSATKVAKKLTDVLNGQGHTDVTLLKLLKITYIAHGWMLGLCNRPLVSENIEAWKYGPVIPELYQNIKGHGRNHINALPDIYDVNLDVQEESIIRQTCELYGKCSAGRLVAVTHAEGTPWWNVWHAEGGAKHGAKIPDSMIQIYYEKLANE